ncbi:hypothetical protein ACK6WK_22280 [Citrobacter portucalensis]|uniref:hypothetical protein n=1 Tax=Citrobacter portucalensis TaxID=1639133 RepID=UPI003C2BE8C7
MKLGTALLLSAGMMLISLSVVNAATPDALIQAHHQRCGKPVFYAQTANHKKEVEICIITPSVSYSFGRTGAEHKEMDITVPAHTTTYAYQSNQVISLQEFTIRNGDTSYQVSAGTNDEGRPFASLDVYQGTPEAGIRLDPDTVVNNISHALAQEGVAESDSL